MDYYPLIASGELTEEATKIEITADNNGEPFNLRAAVFAIEVIPTATNTSDNGSFYFRVNENTAAQGALGTGTNMLRNDTSKPSRKMQVEIIGGLFLTLLGYNGATGTPVTALNSNFSSLTAIYLIGYTSGASTMGVGTRWALYGVREDENG